MTDYVIVENGVEREPTAEEIAELEAWLASIPAPEEERIVSRIEVFDGEIVELKQDTFYYTTTDVTALTITVPESITVSYRSGLDFSCGDPAPTLVYPDTIIWTGDSLDSTRKFVPVHSHRYHIDIWFDGMYVRANTSGVITT